LSAFQGQDRVPPSRVFPEVSGPGLSGA